MGELKKVMVNDVPKKKVASTKWKGQGEINDITSSHLDVLLTLSFQPDLHHLELE